MCKGDSDNAAWRCGSFHHHEVTRGKRALIVSKERCDCCCRQAWNNDWFDRNNWLFRGNRSSWSDRCCWCNSCCLVDGKRCCSGARKHVSALSVIEQDR